MRVLNFTIWVIIVVIIGSTRLSAQQFYLQSGGSLANVHVNDPNEVYTTDTDLKLGYSAGLVAEIPYSSGFYVLTGLLLTQKGYRVNLEQQLGNGAGYKRSLTYVEIPVTIKYQLPKKIYNNDIYVLAGPYIGLGLAGRTKLTIEGNSDFDEISWGRETTDDFRRLDTGITYGGGFKFLNFYFQITHSLGLANIAAFTDDGFSIRNRNLQFSALIPL